MRFKKELAFFGILFLIILFVNIDNTSAASCSIITESNCIGGSQVILRLSGTGNAHGALTSQSNFLGNNVVCCDFGSGSTSCSGTNKFLSLSSLGNAQGERPDTTPVYSTDACYSVKDCRATTSNCVTTGALTDIETEIARLSSTTTSNNLHLGNSASGYTMKVCCKTDTGPIASTITVVSPNGGENWEVASSNAITWTTTGTIANVKIELSRDGVWETLFSSTPNDLSESWTVTNPTTISSLIRISDAADAATNDQSNAVFTISAGVPPCTVDADCATGEICESGTCVPEPECEDDGDCASGETCVEGFCEPEFTGCFTDAYWERDGTKIVGTNNDDLFIDEEEVETVAEGDCDEARFIIKDYSTEETIESDWGSEDSEDLWKWTWATTYPEGALGYKRYYFEARQALPFIVSYANSRSGTGAGLIRVFTSEGIVDCPSYTDHGEEVCTDDPINVATPLEPEQTGGGCEWNSGANQCEQGAIITPPGPETGGGICTYSQDTGGDSCEDGGDEFLSYTMIAEWSGLEEDRPTNCINKSRVVKCPAQIALPFFNKNTFVLAVVAIFGIYFITGLRKKKK